MYSKCENDDDVTKKMHVISLLSKHKIIVKIMCRRNAEGFPDKYLNNRELSRH